MGRAIFTGVVTAIVGAFPLAAVTALFYGFPVPFAGKLSGPGAVVPSQVAVVLYGMIGGFPVLGFAGAIAGASAFLMARPNHPKVAVLGVLLALLCSAAGVVLMATLDLIIGPW
jgi:hypothetical protein